MTTIYTFREESHEASLEAALSVLRRSGIIAMPTETFYALGVYPQDEEALRRLRVIKGRPDAKPIPVLIPDLAHLSNLASEVSAAASLLIDRFWPGPLTIVFSASPRLPEALTGGTGTVGVRMPAHGTVLRLLRHVGTLTGTSANVAGAQPASRVELVQASLGSKLDLILDGGPTLGHLPSTVVNAVGPIRVLRDGQIPREQLEAALHESGLTLA